MLGWLRRRRATGFAALAADYADGIDSAWQLAQFNGQWSQLRLHAPHYRKLAEERRLPAAFSTWQEVQALLPATGRADVRSTAAGMALQTRPADYWRITGGSTAEPVRLPAWKEEAAVASRDVWMARNWWGVTPADPLFMLWGHSHLLGKGWRGKLNGFMRKAKDRLCGYTRVSAYDLSEAALREAGRKLLAARPAWVLGYSVALDRFAKVNADRASAFRSLGLKMAVATAESFPNPQSAGHLSNVLGCPVVMEYGAVETSLIAHQHPADGLFHVLWRSYRVEALPAPEAGEGVWQIAVTSLFPRAFPLVRYRLGDLISPAAGVDVSEAFSRVTGRCNDTLALADGTLIHSEAFTHAVKECAVVEAFQVVQEPGNSVRVRVVSPSPLSRDQESDIRRRFSLIHPLLTSLCIERVSRLEQTLAGKTPFLITRLP
jgi:phenylacetate-CoA ligase